MGRVGMEGRLEDTRISNIHNIVLRLKNGQIKKFSLSMIRCIGHENTAINAIQTAIMMQVQRGGK